MSKGAVVPRMTKAMALEWGRYGINVNALCPGCIDTEIQPPSLADRVGPEAGQHAAAQASEPKDLDVVLTMLCANGATSSMAR